MVLRGSGADLTELRRFATPMFNTRLTLVEKVKNMIDRLPNHCYISGKFPRDGKMKRITSVGYNWWWRDKGEGFFHR